MSSSDCCSMISTLFVPMRWVLQLKQTTISMLSLITKYRVEEAIQAELLAVHISIVSIPLAILLSEDSFHSKRCNSTKAQGNGGCSKATNTRKGFPSLTSPKTWAKKENRVFSILLVYYLICSLDKPMLLQIHRSKKGTPLFQFYFPCYLPCLSDRLNSCEPIDSLLLITVDSIGGLLTRRGLRSTRSGHSHIAPVVPSPLHKNPSQRHPAIYEVEWKSED